jgi:sulfate-transporting ATPase
LRWIGVANEGGNALSGFLQFAILGLGSGAVYALLAQGIVLTYRGSGILNFAQSAMAIFGAFLFWEFHNKHHWPMAPAIIAAIASVTLLGALIHLLVMRPLARSVPLIRVIATLGVLTILRAAATIVWGGGQRIVPNLLPLKTWKFGGAVMTSDRIYLAAIAIGVTVIVSLVYHYTRFGVAVRAAAEDERGAAALGQSPDLLATVNWAAGGALAGIAGILIVPITGLQVDSLTLMLIPAMAAALLGGFSSFWLTMVGGLGIGIAQSEVTRYMTSPVGAADAVPLLVIIAVLVISGRTLPLRSHLLEHLPRLGSGRMTPWALLMPAGLAALMIYAFPDNWNLAFITSLTVAIVLLSVVVLTGFGGQISLAQYAMAGTGALIAGRFVQNNALPFELALLIGVLGAMVGGLLFALPALRTRGINLAVVTLGLGLAVQSVIFGNSNYTGGPFGISIGSPKFFGVNIDATIHPDRYAVFVLIWFVIVTMGVFNVRRGRAGRRLIAVRTNERAAASLGVNVFGAKLFAFAFSAAIAGLAGILMAFDQPVMVFDPFSPFSSINAIVLAVLGGVGFAIGAVSGSVLAVGGIAALFMSHLGVSDNWLVLISGALLLVQLMTAPDGFASLPSRWRARRAEARGKRRPSAPLPAGDLTPHAKVSPAELRVENLGVALGAVQVLSKVDICVRTGEIVGLIGPNGAGKTTLIDAVTGFVRPSGGSIVLGEKAVNRWSAARRARHGMRRSFQSLELFEDVSIRDNILAGADRSGIGPYLTDVFWPRKESIPSTALRAIREFELEDDLDRTPGELPYGRRRLVSIARSLAAEPSILLLDEPAAGLSDAETAELSGLLRRLVEEWGIGILLVEHDMSLVMSVCDSVVALDRGVVIGSGDPATVRAIPEVRQAYLGDVEADGPQTEVPGESRPEDSGSTSSSTESRQSTS